MKILLTAYVRFRNALAWNTFEIAQGLRAAGHDVFLFCKRGSPLARWATAAGIQANYQLDLERASPVEIMRGLCCFRQAIREFQPDVINPHCPPGHVISAIARATEKSRAALIRTIADPRPPKKNPFNRHLHQRTSDGLIFTSDSSLVRYRRNLSELKPPMRVILPGIRADDFVAGTIKGRYRNQFGLRDDQILAGIIARKSPEKGQEVLIEALTFLSLDERSRIIVALAGEDSKERGRSDLEKMANQLGVLENLRFLGELDDVRPLMAELDLGIITSTQSEAICRVALEYMSFGIPIISSDVNILSEVVRNNINGWVFPNKDARVLSEHLREAIASPDKRKQRGEQGKVMSLSEFSFQRELDETVEFFQEMIRKRRVAAD